MRTYAMARGRKPRAGDAARHVLGVRFTDSEKAKLEQAAEREHLQLATWLRQVALKAADHVLAGSTSPETTRTRTRRSVPRTPRRT